MNTRDQGVLYSGYSVVTSRRVFTNTRVKCIHLKEGPHEHRGTMPLPQGEISPTRDLMNTNVYRIRLKERLHKYKSLMYSPQGGIS